MDLDKSLDTFRENSFKFQISGVREQTTLSFVHQTARAVRNNPPWFSLSRARRLLLRSQLGRGASSGCFKERTAPSSTDTVNKFLGKKRETFSGFSSFSVFDQCPHDQNSLVKAAKYSNKATGLAVAAWDCRA
jgi:hypothetical protein